jgi:predicted nucleic acid-binding protein
VALVLDTGPIVALLDACDPAHDRCVAMVADLGEDLVVPAAVLIEVDHWLLKLYGHAPWQIFVEDVAKGAYRLHPLSPQTLTRAAELEQEYPSLDLGLVDASVIATCEELDESKVATLDRRDFSAVRPCHRDHLILLPE